MLKNFPFAQWSGSSIRLRLFAASCLLLTSCLNQDDIIVRIKDKPFLMEIAKTFEEQQSGLMHREKLDSNKGMIFIYEEEDRHSFWMKNTLIPLDIIWLSKSKKVVYISKNARPCKADNCRTIKPDKNASYVLEINANLSDKLRLKKGDLIEFDVNS